MDLPIVNAHQGASDQAKLSMHSTKSYQRVHRLFAYFSPRPYLSTRSYQKAAHTMPNLVNKDYLVKALSS